MSWTEILIDVERTQAESLSDAFMETGALSVSIEDANMGTQAEQPLFGEPGMEPSQTGWEYSRIVALTPADMDHPALVAQAANKAGLDRPPLFSLRHVAEQDWVRLTQSQFAPIHIGKNIWVVPSWHDAPDPSGLILELDPGLAFGTGSHPTTRLCMEWLEAHPPVDKTVLDYGCGSGILAMTAKKLGAREVIGIDIDPQAIKAAHENMARNHCDVACYLPDDFAATFHEHTFDVVVANILANPLRLMAPMLASRLKPQGQLLLSGILASQAEDICAIYRPFIELSVWRTQEDWVALSGCLLV